MAYFGTFLLGPLMDFFHQRPLICGRAWCKPTVQPHAATCLLLFGAAEAWAHRAVLQTHCLNTTPPPARVHGAGVAHRCAPDHYTYDQIVEKWTAIHGTDPLPTKPAAGSKNKDNAYGELDHDDARIPVPSRCMNAIEYRKGEYPWGQWGCWNLQVRRDVSVDTSRSCCSEMRRHCSARRHSGMRCRFSQQRPSPTAAPPASRMVQSSKD